MNKRCSRPIVQGVTVQAGGPGPLSALASFTGSFTYDPLNRLATASDSGGWSRTFGYDQYGNMWVSGSSGIPLAGNTPTLNVYTGANQIGPACNQPGTAYDCAGNQLSVNGDTVVYDAENRQTSVTEPPSMGSGTETLVYDGDGRRVQKILPSGTTNYVYDAFGRLAAEYSTIPAYSPCTTCYLSYDYLGSLRMVTDASGAVISRHDYLPFGEEIPPDSAGRTGQWGPGTDNVSQKFTGQIRDEETKLDYFNARYFGAALGRFTSPDPGNAGADPMSPQSWNGYGYVRNNPLANTDVTGMWCDEKCGPANNGGGGWDPFQLQEIPVIAEAEAQYVADLQQTRSDVKAAQLANRLLASGEPITAGFVAAMNPNLVAVPVAPKTPDPVYNAFAVGAAMVGIDPTADVQVLAQRRGVATSVQLTPLGNGTPYQRSALTLDPNSAGTADPLTSWHEGNPSWYVGGDTNAMHVVDITTPPTDPNDPFQVGLQFHVDAYNPTASVVNLFQHFVNEVIPGRGVGTPFSRTCSVNRGCR